MQHGQFEDSIDDLISLLNFQKSSTNNLRETTNLPNPVDDALEIGNLLNSSYAKPQQTKPRNLSANSDKAPVKTLGGIQRPLARVSMKSDLISRNFFNKTASHSDSVERNKEYDENKAEQQNVNLTLHPKVAMTGAIRYLKFEPLLTELKTRPSTPPDHGYYFKFNLSDVKLIKHLLEANGFKETNNSNSFSIMWSTGPIKNDVYQSLGYYQKVNHFPRSHEITRKDSMHRNISRMQTAYGVKNFNFIPKSFILPSECPLLEADIERNKGMWYIVKPQASSQGRGIFITNKLEEITAKQNNQIIVSQYINDPFLINDLKFDLRVYVAVTCVNPLRIYIYNEGLARFATIPYTKDKYVNRFVHLTNYSINKKSEAFVQNDDAEDEESCSKWSFATFKTYLESIGIDHKPIFRGIEDVVIKTILSIESILFTTNVTQVPQRHNCFELFGFDILLDSKLKPWLLEVNLSPSLGCESALDLKIKSELMSDLFNMTGVAPLDQRTYYETSFFGKNQNVLSYGGTAPNFDKKPQSNAYTEAKPVDNLTKEEKAVIKETNEEWERRGNFKRVYPSANVLDYKNYFETDRPYNALLRNVIFNNMKKTTRKPDIPKQPINPKKFC